MHIELVMQNQIIDIKFKKVNESLNFLPTLVIGQTGDKDNFIDIKEISLTDYSFGLKLSEIKYCIGYPGAENYVKCKFNNKLEKGTETRCGYCESQFGFRKAFFLGEATNEMMQNYLTTDHLVYLAYFNNDIVKVGTCVESRMHLRQIEQDALFYTFVARVRGSEVQSLEKFISQKLNITENIKSSTKFKNLSFKINTERAKQVLENKVEALKNLVIDTEFANNVFDKIDFYDLTQNSAIFYPDEKINIINNFNDELALVGKFKGLRANFLFFENNEKLMCIDKRILIGRLIEGEVLEWEYKILEDEQLSLI